MALDEPKQHQIKVILHYGNTVSEMQILKVNRPQKDTFDDLEVVLRWIEGMSFITGFDWKTGKLTAYNVRNARRIEVENID